MRKDSRDVTEATQLQAIELIIQSVSESAQADVRNSFDTCFSILDILRRVDLREFEAMEPEEAVAAMEYGTAMEVQGALTDAIKLLGTWTECVLGGAEGRFNKLEKTQSSSEAPEAEPAASPRAIDGIVQPKRDRFCEDLDR